MSAAATTISDVQEGTSSEMLDGYPIQTAYLKFVMGVQDTRSTTTKAPYPKARRGTIASVSIGKKIDELMAQTDSPKPLSRYAQDKTICFLWKLAGPKARALLEDLIERRYYKRVIEISLADFGEAGYLSLRDYLVKNRIEFQTRVEGALIRLLNTSIQGQSSTRASIVEDKLLERLNKVQGDRFVFLPDLPLRGWLPSGEDPLFVSDFKRRHFRADVGALAGGSVNSLWTEHIGKMMRRIAFFRVFCEPDVHLILKRVVSAQDVLNALRDEFPDIRFPNV